MNGPPLSKHSCRKSSTCIAASAVLIRKLPPARGAQRGGDELTRQLGYAVRPARLVDVEHG
jgi:hypothetical protein